MANQQSQTTIDIWFHNHHMTTTYYDLTPFEAGQKVLTTPLHYAPYADLKLRVALLPFEPTETYSIFAGVSRKTIGFEVEFFEWDSVSKSYQPVIYKMVARWEVIE